MNNCFDIRRFWKYFCYEINNVRTRFGFSLLVLAFFPILMFICFGVFHILFADTHNWYVNGASCAISAYIMVFLALVLSFPVKVYGGLTEKKQGSSWILMPASALEKTVSMVIIAAVLVPCIVSGVNFLCDCVIRIFDPSYKGVYKALFDSLSTDSSPLVITGGGILPLMLSMAQNMLVFLLGAILFRRAKVGKTFLSVFALAMVVALVTFLFFGNTHFGPEDIEDENVELFLNGIINTIYFVIFATLDIAIYLRVKTIKQ